MPIHFGNGHWSRVLLLLFSVDMVRTYLAIVVGLVEFGSVTAFNQNQINKRKKSSKSKILSKNTNFDCFS